MSLESAVVTGFFLASTVLGKSVLTGETQNGIEDVQRPLRNICVDQLFTGKVNTFAIFRQ